MSGSTIDRRTRFLLAVGPHKPAGEKRWVDVPAARGVAAHRDHIVATTCGREVQTTLVTEQDDQVRCPACLAGMTADEYRTRRGQEQDSSEGGERGR